MNADAYESECGMRAERRLCWKLVLVYASSSNKNSIIYTLCTISTERLHRMNYDWDGISDRFLICRHRILNYYSRLLKCRLYVDGRRARSTSAHGTTWNEWKEGMAIAMKIKAEKEINEVRELRPIKICSAVFWSMTCVIAMLSHLCLCLMSRKCEKYFHFIGLFSSRLNHMYTTLHMAEMKWIQILTWSSARSTSHWDRSISNLENSCCMKCKAPGIE